jgi:hypothetical protein
MSSSAMAESDIETRLAFDHLTLALKGIRPIIWLLPLITLATVITFSNWIAWPRLLAWSALVVTSIVPYALLTRSFLNRGSASSRSIRYWHCLICPTYALQAGAWATLPYFLWLPGDDFNHCMIEMLLGCSVGSIPPFYSASRPLMALGFAIYGGALVVTPLFGNSPAMHSLLLIAAPYVALLWISPKSSPEASSFRKRRSTWVIWFQTPCG